MNSRSFESKSVHGVGQLVFHLEWCPKYRYNMLRQKRFKDFLARILEEESTKLRCKIIEIGIEDDHVHLVIATRPSISISELLQQLKGRSSYELFRFEPKFRLRYPQGSPWHINRIGINSTPLSCCISNLTLYAHYAEDLYKQARKVKKPLLGEATGKMQR